jgi:hypothetical protein
MSFSLAAEMLGLLCLVSFYIHNFLIILFKSTAVSWGAYEPFLLLNSDSYFSLTAVMLGLLCLVSFFYLQLANFPFKLTAVSWGVCEPFFISKRQT